METELECGMRSKPAAAGAHCLSRGGGAKAVECALNACEVVDPDPLRRSDGRLPHWPGRAISARFHTRGSGDSLVAISHSDISQLRQSAAMTSA
jgi:hypothetical protein